MPTICIWCSINEMQQGITLEVFPETPANHILAYHSDIAKTTVELLGLERELTIALPGNWLQHAIGKASE